MEVLSKLRRLGLFDARVPRYTSYPPANHFSDQAGSDNMGDWLASVQGGQEVSLYVHVPFCRRLCWFCACRTQGTSSAAPVEAYVDTLSAELRLVGQRLAPGMRLSRLHWGGGTPTLLTPEAITRLAREITRLAPFAPGAEFSVEIDPNEIDDARLDALAEAGMTRASVGVQDFDADIQATIGRDQSFGITRRAIEGLRDRGVSSVNIDLLYGLPLQTVETLSETVQKVLSLAPDRIALYGYAHVPWMARRQSLIPSDTLPHPEERLSLFETAQRLFTWDGFDEIGIDHFARPGDRLAQAASEGRLRRNFQGYTDDQSRVLLGIGASAISQFPQGYAQNAPATSAYIKAIREGRLAAGRGHVLSREDRIRATLIEMLMCGFRIDPVEAAERTSEPVARIRDRLAGMEEAFPGMMSVSNGCYTIRKEARPMTRMIARHLDLYSAGNNAHSAAV